MCCFSPRGVRCLSRSLRQDALLRGIWVLFPLSRYAWAQVRYKNTNANAWHLIESQYLMNNPSLSMSPYHPPSHALSQIQLPVLTAFIPSLAQNSPFRVSVHSWERPRPSRMMESIMQPEDAVLYEVRVYIDGVCVSGSIFNQRTLWPHVISMLALTSDSLVVDSLLTSVLDMSSRRFF